MAIRHTQSAKWKMPPFSIFGVITRDPADAGDVQHIANTIRETISEFGIAVEMIEANVGPKITQYVLQLPAGVPMEKIMQLEANIALNLRALSIRITEVASDNNLVAIEVPNRKAADVPLNSILNSKEWQDSTSPLSIALGKDIFGKPVIADLSKMQHVLFAGQTGSGKSVMSNVILTSLLFQRNPDELKLILIDPKQVEMAPYEDIPHLQMPVITEPEQWREAFSWLGDEVDRRTNSFAEHNVTSIEDYNNVAKEHLPYIVVLTDEFSDLMMSDGRLVEKAVTKISVMAKNTGIHLIFSTSRPSIDVFTGILKVNMPTHWAFVTASKFDSMVVLDEPGAEKLLGQGDLLFRQESNAAVVRVQAAYITDDEVKTVADFWAEQDVEDRTDTSNYDGENIKSELMEDFEYFVSAQVGHHYKKGFRWKSKLRWQLVRVWQSRITNIGIPGLVKEKLGEDEAQRLYEDIADKIINDPELLEDAVKTARESNPFA